MGVLGMDTSRIHLLKPHLKLFLNSSLRSLWCCAFGTVDDETPSEIPIVKPADRQCPLRLGINEPKSPSLFFVSLEVVFGYQFILRLESRAI